MLTERRAIPETGLISAGPITAAYHTTPAWPDSFSTPDGNPNALSQGSITRSFAQDLASPALALTDSSPSTANASTGADSGYGSFVATPEKESPGKSLARKLFKRKPTRVSIFERDIPEKVHNRFQDLVVLFNEPLYRYLRQYRVTTSAISIKLKYAGESEATARPWIVIQCDETASKRVNKFFNQQQIKAHYQPRDADSQRLHFGLSVRGTPPKQIASTFNNDVYSESWDNTTTLCGKVIRVNACNETRIATLGGIIKVITSEEKVKLYGMTAGHIIARDQDARDYDIRIGPSTSSDEHSLVDRMLPDKHGDSDESGSSSEEEDEEEFELDFGDEGESDRKSHLHSTELSQSIWRSTQLSQPWPKVGRLFAASHRDSDNVDLDWALIELEDPALYRPNLLVFPEGTYEFGLSTDLKECPRRITRASCARDILLLSGMAGLKRGKLSAASGFLMIGRSKGFNKTYTVSLSDGSVLDAGDCGSWVVDSVTHEVYGHVIASDAFGEAYVVPLDATLRDITQKILGDCVCLPTEDDVKEWIDQYGRADAINGARANGYCSEDPASYPYPRFLESGLCDATSTLFAIPQIDISSSHLEDESFDLSYMFGEVPEVLQTPTPHNWSVEPDNLRRNSSWSSVNSSSYSPAYGHVASESCSDSGYSSMRSSPGGRSLRSGERPPFEQGKAHK